MCVYVYEYVYIGIYIYIHTNLKIVLGSHKGRNSLISESDQMFGQGILQLPSLTTLSPTSDNITIRYVPEGNIPWQKISVWNGANEDQGFCITYYYCI